MSNNKKLINHLEKNKIKHEVLPHKTVYTAYDKAQTLNVKLSQIVKTLLIKAEKNHHLVLLSADKMLDFKKLAKILKVKKIEIIGEKGMLKLLKMKKEALHTFGSLHQLPIIVDKGLTKIKEAVFPSASFVASIKMKVKDYLNLEKPAVGDIGAAKKASKKKKTK